MTFNNNWLGCGSATIHFYASEIGFPTLACALSVQMVAVELNVLCKSISMLWIALSVYVHVAYGHVLQTKEI